ncbi:MAG: DUF2459 domain-containing protein [Bacteroidetes bacterium]|nr:MAG: DUF2459 domain-containing protein [Bacteroidota bacterium]
MKKTLKLVAKTLIFFGTMLFVYAIYVFISYIFPKNSDYQKISEGVEIFVRTNDFHTDLLVPLKNDQQNWETFFDPNPIYLSEKMDYCAVGWGDEGFYMESFEEKFPSKMTIFKAIFLPSPTLMHVEFCPKPKEKNYCIKIVLSAENYQKLVDFIAQSFEKKDAKLLINSEKGYANSDCFYKALGNYHLFRTCNDWTCEGLQKAGVKVPQNAPFEFMLMNYLKENK